MKELLVTLLEDSGDLSLEQILLQIAVSAVIGLVICISYKLSHIGTLYSRKFNITLLTLTVLTATVMTVIGNNIALSLGMVGALSIVRFRTAIKDARDTAYIFWTIIVGICCGVGDFEVAGIGSGVVFLLLLLFGAIRNDDRLLLIVRCKMRAMPKVESVIFKYFGYRAKLRVKNSTPEAAELIYEITRSMITKAEKNKAPVVEAIHELSDIEYANLVVQNDDIGG